MLVTKIHSYCCNHFNRLFIGAPKGTSNDPTYSANVHETGVIWRCSLGTRNNFNDVCEILHVDPVSNTGSISTKLCA